MRDSSLPLASARTQILAALTPLTGHQTLTLDQAHGRVLAADLIAPRSLPPHDNAAMDGYALRCANLRTDADSRLRIVAQVFAGHPFAGTIGAGEAARIMTGAALPAGTDCVIMQEQAQLDGDEVIIPSSAPRQPGQHIRRAGEDFRINTLALAAGQRCGVAQLHALAALGIASVRCYRRPRVAVFSTGDELVAPGSTLAAAQIYDSNRAGLLAAAQALGCEVLDLGIIADQAAALENALRSAAASADVILSSGGISAGDADYIRPAVARCGALQFWKLALKPGRPFSFGHIGQAVFFGLPGNPLASRVTFTELVRPALLKLMGEDPLPPTRQFSARASFDYRKRPGRREFLCGRSSGNGAALSVALSGPQGSAMLSSLLAADCFIVLDEACAAVQHGEPVTIQFFDDLP